MKNLSAIILGLITLNSLPVYAEAISNAYLGPLQYTLIDLDLTDNITPSISFNINNSFIQTGVNVPNDNAFYEQTSNAFDNLSSSLSLDGRNATASVSGAGYGDINVSSSGNAFGSLNPIGTPQSGYGSRANNQGFFTLSGNTQVVFSVFASIEAYSTGPIVSYDDIALREGSFASASFAAYTTIDGNYIGDGGAIDVTTFNFTSPLPDGLSPARQSEIESTTFTVAISNLLFDSIDGSLLYATETNGYSSFEKQEVSAVPLPAALPLMASGLFLFGFGLRKKST